MIRNDINCNIFLWKIIGIIMRFSPVVPHKGQLIYTCRCFYSKCFLLYLYTQWEKVLCTKTWGHSSITVKWKLPLTIYNTTRNLSRALRSSEDNGAHDLFCCWMISCGSGKIRFFGSCGDARGDELRGGSDILGSR